MKKILSLILLTALVLSMSSFIFVQEQSGQYIIVFKTVVDSVVTEQLKEKTVRMYSNFPALVVRIPDYMLKGLAMLPNIESIEEDFVISTAEQTPDWGIARTGAPGAWASDYTGDGVKIAVVDTGIAAHEDLKPVAGGASMVSYTTSYSDDNGHGTHVAGIINAINNGIGSVGIAPGSALYAVKVLDRDGSGYISNVAAGVDWAITNGMDIINLSLGSSRSSTTLKRAVDSAYSKGILVVAAAGNTGNSAGTGDNVQYPAKYDSVIAAAATDINDKRATFSSTGSTVEAAAPGVGILSTYTGNQYVSLSGTSMAAPYVSGNLALIMDAFPDLSAAEVRAKLRETAFDLGAAGKDPLYGYGLIQAPAAGSGTIPDPEPEPDPDPEPPVVRETLTVITTDKSSYTRGQSVYITVKVTDTENTVIPGAAVKITVKPVYGTTTTLNGTTNGEGIFTAVYTTRFYSFRGTYTITATSTYGDYTPSTATKTFTLT